MYTYKSSSYILTIKQANGVTSVISLLSWMEPTSFTCPLLCEVRSLNGTVPRCSSGTMTTMLVQGSSSCTSASLRAFETPPEMHEERDGSTAKLHYQGGFHKQNLPTLSVIMTLRGEGVGGMTLIFSESLCTCVLKIIIPDMFNTYSLIYGHVLSV